MNTKGQRIAMWSGPRNLSTAMMRSFGNHPAVCSVVDEPFYAAYLAATGKDHPMTGAILASQSWAWDEVISDCVDRSVPKGMFAYQKHMTHHMLPGVSREWLREVTNVFLIRHPRRVLASYARRMESINLEDIGFVQQAELFDLVTDFEGFAPVVVDAEDIRSDPRGVLNRLCEKIGMEFDAAMLHWPSGPRSSDGVWAAHWYASVNRSNSFAAPDAEPAGMPDYLEKISEAAMPAYDRLLAYRI